MQPVLYRHKDTLSFPPGERYAAWCYSVDDWEVGAVGKTSRQFANDIFVLLQYGYLRHPNIAGPRLTVFLFLVQDQFVLITEKEVERYLVKI